VRVFAKANEDFKLFLPKECAYSLDEVDVFWVRNGNLKGQTTVRNGSNNLRERFNDLKAGDNLVFEVKKASRKNYLGMSEVAKINNPILSISIK
jgi:hypothetical protein